MLNKSVLSVLSKLNNISDKVVLRYPVTTFSSDSGDMIANVNISLLDSDQFEELGIYELSKLISLINLFDDDYKIQKEDNKLIIKSESNIAVYLVSDVFLLKHNDKSANIIDSLENFPTVAEFILDSETIKKFNKASSIFGDLGGVKFKAEDSKTEISLTKVNRFDSSNNGYSKTYLNSSSKDFSYIIDTNNFNKLPVMDYRVKVKFNETKNAYRVVFESDLFKVIIAELATN